MNVELLEKVKEHILEEPRRLRMGEWTSTNLDGLDIPADERPACGTVACIAGWAMALSEVDPWQREGSYSEIADELLDLTERAGQRLYFLGSWPDELGDAYISAETPQERADVTARRIDHFIVTDGAE